MRLSTLLPVSLTFLSVVFAAPLLEANIDTVRTRRPTASDEFVGINITTEEAKVPQELSTWGPHPEPCLMCNSVIIWYRPQTFPLDPRARAEQNFEILTRKPRPQPDKNEGLEPGYLGQVSGQKRQARSILRSS
ncbi:hypothetical protein B0H14DRAFT_2574337 [Mycena olivaceomarginata]|nr:hypothetical protein B0H14DRAFT_2574337 [Mycena olivaceomarginata]